MITILAVWVAALQAKEPPLLRFRNISLEQGLSNASVICILQDRTGFVWIGTRGGLNRWDGLHMQVYHSNPLDSTSLPEEFITALAETAQEEFWVGTSQSGLCRLDRSRQKFELFRADSVNGKTIPDDRITVLKTTSDGRLWVGTQTGLGIRTREVSSFNQIILPRISESPDDQWITAMAGDLDHGVWVGTMSGRLLHVDPETLQADWIHAEQFAPTEAGTNRINGIVLDDKRNLLWLAIFPMGLFSMDLPSGRLSYFGTSSLDPNVPAINAIRDLALGEDSRIWMSSVQGITIYDPDRSEYEFHRSDPLDVHSPHDEVYENVYRDAQGLLWFGSGAHGVDLCNPAQVRFQHFRFDGNSGSLLQASKVYGMTMDRDGRLWLATLPGGFQRLDLGRGKSRTWQTDDSDPEVWSMNYGSKVMVDHQARVWMATFEAGLFRWDPGDGSLEHFNSLAGSRAVLSGNNIYALTETGDRSVWVGTRGDGLNRIDPRSDSTTIYRHDPGEPSTLASDNIYTLLEDHAGVLWVGMMNGGIDRWNSGSEDFTHFPLSTSRTGIPSNTALCLAEDTQNRLWIGTRAGGLVYLDAERANFHIMDLGIDPSSLEICKILFDDEGGLWASSNRGILKIDPENGLEAAFQEEDGVQGREFFWNSGTRDTDGNCYFGGVNGFNRFHPDSVHMNRHLPPVILTGLWVNHEPVAVGDRIGRQLILPQAVQYLDTLVLTYRAKVLQFSYAALDYSNPELNSYRVRMRGFDPTWIEMGHETIAKYTNLQSGWYEMQVQGSNNDQVWNEVPSQLSIHILPPFWATVWFRMIALIAAGSILAVLVWLRVRHLELRKRELEALVRERTAQLQTEMEERRRVEREKALQETEYLRRELLTKTLYLDENQQLLESLHSDLAPLTAELTGKPRISFGKILKQLRSSSRLQHSWEEFEHWFTEVHTKFYDNLRAREAGLSQSELKICALLRLNLLSKDIASIMNVQPSSVDIYRHRIRKKLGLRTAENLVEYLAQL